MKDSLICKRLEVRKSAIHGYGVFALEDIAEGEVIEECYFLETKKTCSLLQDYYYGDEKVTLIVLGYGSIYNHANSPNANMEFPVNEFFAQVTAITAIQKDDEIFIYYGPQWFQTRRINFIDPKGLRNRIRIINIFLGIARFLIVISFLFFILNFINYLK